MKGVQIFTHAVRQVTGNFGMAVRVSALLYVLLWGVTMAVDFENTYGAGAASSQPVAPDGFSILVFLVVNILAASWIAVGWHRYVLLVELPGAVPAFHKREIGQYVWKGLIILGMIIIPIIGIFMGLFFIGYFLKMRGALEVFGALAVFPVLVWAQRLGTVLPGIALGEEHSVFEGLAKTKGRVLPIAISLAMFAGLTLGAQFVGSTLLGGVTALQIPWDFVVGWVQLMLGVSLLTTLYGHYIQGRPLV